MEGAFSRCFRGKLKTSIASLSAPAPEGWSESCRGTIAIVAAEWWQFEAQGPPTDPIVAFAPFFGIPSGEGSQMKPMWI
jgi:hypothetical protein